MTTTCGARGTCTRSPRRSPTAGESLVERRESSRAWTCSTWAAGPATPPSRRPSWRARVTGLDFSPGLIEIARETGPTRWSRSTGSRATPRTLPFEDDSFDRVISIFGHMFAPDHRRTADELRRVCRPGGRIAIACWTPEGKLGQMFRRMSAISALRRPKASSRRCSGAPRTTCASCSARARVRAPRRRVGRRVGRGLRPVHGGQLRPPLIAARKSRSGDEPCTRPTWRS